MAVRMKILSLMSVVLLLSGCAVPRPPLPHRAHPGLEERSKTIKTVVVLAPRVEVFQISAGGVKEKMDEWSTRAKTNVNTALEGHLTGRSELRVKTLSEESLSEDVKSNLEETYALFDAVRESIIVHTYGSPENRFPEKIHDFDYSLGKEVQGLGMGDADALLLVEGIDHISSGGRKALEGVGLFFRIAAAVGIAVATGVVLVPSATGTGGVTVVTLALVDAQTGSLLWYRHAGSAGNHDLRDSASAAQLVSSLLAGSPIQ